MTVVTTQETLPENEIKTMQLYNHVERVYNELRHAGYAIESNEPLSVKLLSQFDSLHYFGNEACDSAITFCNINSNSTILDVGSGLGGPARYLAHQTGCNVVALELQGELSFSADLLTSKCGLSDKVIHLQGDFLETKVEENTYDVLVSWLVFLHISNRKLLSEQCFRSLKNGGILYVEDYYCISPFTKEEMDLLKRDVYVSYLPTKEEIVQQLKDAGFVDIQLVDMTQKWKEYVLERTNQYALNFEKHSSIQGPEAAKGLSHFYTSVSKLFQGGRLGGVLYTARKP